MAFTYNFVPTGDGHCRIEIVYDEAFLQDALESGTEYINNVSASAIFNQRKKENRRKRYKACDDVVRMTGVEPT